MPKRPPPVFLPSIRRDIQDIVMWSEDRFGVAAADRYSALIRQALRDVQADPLRPNPHCYSLFGVFHLRG